MKILIIIHAITTGGAERQVTQDANMLAKDGHTVVVCYGKNGELKNQFLSAVNLLCLKTTSQITASIKLWLYLRKNRFDIVISHMFWANKVAVLTGALTGHKVIVFEHGLGLWRKWYHLLFVRLVANYASSIVTCSEASKKIRITKEKIPSGKIIVIPNSFGVPESIQNDSVPIINDSKDTFTIGYAGRFNAVKQLHFLIPIALLIKNEIKDFRFMLLGDGTEKSSIEKQVNNNGINEYFVFTGYVSNPLRYLVNMDCFILPSKREDFSLALLEAAYAGLPCIAFNVGGNNEIIADGKTGWLVEPYDIGIMAQKIIWLCKNQDKAKKMGELAKERVKELYSLEQRSANLVKLIQKTI